MPRHEAVQITIDTNVPCRECGRKGATQNGLCLKCIGKEIAKRGVVTMEPVKTVFMLSDVHPKVKIDKDGVAEHVLTVKLDTAAYLQADAHRLTDMLGHMVTVSIAVHQPSLDLGKSIGKVK